jgi:hypothetical protein
MDMNEDRGQQGTRLHPLHLTRRLPKTKADMLNGESNTPSPSMSCLDIFSLHLERCRRSLTVIAVNWHLSPRKWSHMFLGEHPLPQQRRRVV